jgi:hypothetical protein
MNGDPASLDRLHDVIMPPPAPWWPPAPGWYWLGCIALVWLAYLLVCVFVHWQRNRYRRQALAEWRLQKELLADEKTRSVGLANLAVLLKRAALSAYSRADVARLTGREWRAFLDRSAGMIGFSSDAGALLERAAYGGGGGGVFDEKQANEAAALVHRWLTTHRAGETG